MSSSEGADDRTRKQRREAARDERRQQERQANAQAMRRKRLSMLGGAVVVVAAAVVIAIVVSSSGGGTSSSGLKKGASQGALISQINGLIGGIPQNGTTLGQPNAPVTLVYYGDLQCPVCRDFSLNTLPQVITDLVRPGKLKVTYRSLQTATQNPQTFLTQQVAAMAAGPQSKAWQYIELFYHQQGQEDTDYVTEGYLDRLAQQVPGLNLSTWQSARNDSSLAQAVKADESHATSLGLGSTPTLIAEGPKGNKGVSGFVPYSSIAGLVQAVR